MNPLYQQFNGGNTLFQRFQQFRQMITGDPRQQVQQMLNTGRITQDQYNRAVQMANQLQRIFSGK